MNTNLFGNSIFADDQDEASRAGRSQHDRCPHKKGSVGKRQVRMEGRQYENIGRMSSTSQRLPKATRSRRKALRRNQPRGHLDFGFVASRSMKE